MVDKSKKPKAPAPRKTASRKGTAAERLSEIGIDAICDWIIEGKTYEWIGTQVECNRSTVMRWLQSDPQRSARASSAREESAAAEDDLALKAIRDLPNDASSAQIAAMREEVQHRRWRAKVRNPVKYGDRIAVDHGLDGETPELLKELGAIIGASGE